MLIVELDGPAAQVAEESAAVEEICTRFGAFGLHAAETPEERARIWRGRKSSFAAMGRIASSYYVQDGVVPRTRLPEVLRRTAELSAEYGLRVASVFHAGDGNLHPLVLYDESVEGEPERAEALATAILDACIDAGGSLTGEHGVGVDKACSMPKLFGERDLEAMQLLRVGLRSRRALEPGQDLPDAAALRRGSRPLPCAPAGAGRACRASLSRRPSRRPRPSSLPGRASRSSAKAARSCSRRRR